MRETTWSDGERSLDSHGSSSLVHWTDDRSGGSHAPTLTTSGAGSTGREFRPADERARSVQIPAVAAPADRHRSRALFASCVDHIEAAIDNEAEFFLRNNSLERLRETLAEVWSMRQKREEAFAEIVNSLQGVFAATQVEDFTDAQLAALRHALVRLRDEGSCDDDFVNQLTLDLLNGGVDVFRELE